MSLPLNSVAEGAEGQASAKNDAPLTSSRKKRKSAVAGLSSPVAEESTPKKQDLFQGGLFGGVQSSIAGAASTLTATMFFDPSDTAKLNPMQMARIGRLIKNMQDLKYADDNIRTVVKGMIGVSSLSDLTSNMLEVLLSHLQT